jgi:hypothetical protein
MLHKLALVVLLPAMLLNGLWVMCPPQDGADSPESAKESADCIRICAALEASLGTICLLFPGHANASITVIDYGAAIFLAHATLKQPVYTDHRFQPMAASSYGDPYLSSSTPPPRLGLIS